MSCADSITAAYDSARVFGAIANQMPFIGIMGGRLKIPPLGYFRLRRGEALSSSLDIVSLLVGFLYELDGVPRSDTISKRGGIECN
jgi:hypothetical protein